MLINTKDDYDDTRHGTLAQRTASDRALRRWMIENKIIRPASAPRDPQDFGRLFGVPVFPLLEKKQ
jgi:hypothetical protein